MVDTIIQNEKEITIVQVVEDNKVYNIDQVTNIIETPSETIVVYDDTPTIIQTFEGPPGPEGPTGPQGPAGGEDVPLSKQVDFVDETHIYIGEANPGTTLSAAAWRIKYVVLASDDDVSITWASGNDSFDKVWDNRASYSYS